jgi:hypothetical protein
MIYLLLLPVLYCLAFWYFKPYHSRYNYWSCTKFADWVRGSAKPYALGWDEWDDWHHDAKAIHPVRHWIAEKLLNKVQDFLLFPQDVYRSIDCYIDNRFVVKTHYLPTRLQKGEWYDFDTRLMHGMFEGLVDYVELECAGMNRIGEPKKPRRSAYHGLSYLNWEMGLKYDESMGLNPGDERYGEPTHQAEWAAKVAYLYYWWKEKRPNRKDPFENYKEGDDYVATRDAEQAYVDEDEAMMIRLVKASKGMWT